MNMPISELIEIKKEADKIAQELKNA